VAGGCIVDGGYWEPGAGRCSGAATVRTVYKFFYGKPSARRQLRAHDLLWRLRFARHAGSAQLKVKSRRCHNCKHLAGSERQWMQPCLGRPWLRQRLLDSVANVWCLGCGYRQRSAVMVRGAECRPGARLGMGCRRWYMHQVAGWHTDFGCGCWAAEAGLLVRIEPLSA